MKDTDAHERAMQLLRNHALKDLAVVIEHYWGKRCTDNQAGCHTCSAWAIYDCMQKLTEVEDE